MRCTNRKKKDAAYLKTYWYKQENEWKNNNNNKGEYKIVKKVNKEIK